MDSPAEARIAQETKARFEAMQAEESEQIAREARETVELVLREQQARRERDGRAGERRGLRRRLWQAVGRLVSRFRVRDSDSQG